MRTSGTLLVLCCIGCTAVQATAPKGFAPLQHGDDYRAVHAEGLVYRVRQEDNAPRAELAFWAQALKHRMKQTGYILVAEQPIRASNLPGKLLELAAPVGDKDHAYLVAIFVRGDTLTIAEAAGERQQLKTQRAQIIAAIRQIRW